MKTKELFAAAIALSIAAWVGVSAPSANAATYHVVLLGGQSNMDGNGNAHTSLLPTNLQQPQTNVLYNNSNNSGTPTESYYTGNVLAALQPGSVNSSPADHFGPEITFGRDIAADNPQNKYVIIKYAVAGSSLSGNWLAPNSTSSTTGNCYAAFKTAVSNALSLIPKTSGGKNDYQIDAMLWVQGETDANSQGSAEAYQSRLNDLIVNVRQTYGANLPFIIGGIGYVTGVTDTNSGLNTRTIVQSAFANEAATIPGVEYFNNDDINTTHQLHFDATGQQIIGSRFAAALQAIPEPSTFSLLAAGGVMTLAGRKQFFRSATPQRGS